MVLASFEYEGNNGTLAVVTHFGETHVIFCEKHTDESFRLGGTAVNDVAFYEGVILKLPTISTLTHFRAFYTSEDFFESTGILSNEQWDVADLHCYVTEYYPLDMEGQKPLWFISKKPIKDSNYLFINIDVLDGGGNIIKRYRVSPFTGLLRILNG